MDLLIHILLSILSNGQTDQTPSCPPGEGNGYGLERRDTHCVPCVEGKTFSTHNDNEPCRICTPHPDGNYKILRHCNITHDSRYGCITGYFDSPPYHDCAQSCCRCGYGAWKIKKCLTDGLHPEDSCGTNIYGKCTKANGLKKRNNTTDNLHLINGNQTPTSVPDATYRGITEYIDPPTLTSTKQMVGVKGYTTGEKRETLHPTPADRWIQLNGTPLYQTLVRPRKPITDDTIEYITALLIVVTTLILFLIICLFIGKNNSNPQPVYTVTAMETAV